MVELVTLPDVERMVALELLERAGLQDWPELTAGRIYTATPRDVGGDPFVLVRRVGGDPVISRPLVLDEATLQLDAYGGSKRQAHALARRLQHELSELVGELDDGVLVGYVTGTTLGPLRYLPDPAFDPARPRYLLDVDVFCKIGRLVEPTGTTVADVTATGTTP